MNAAPVAETLVGSILETLKTIVSAPDGGQGEDVLRCCEGLLELVGLLGTAGVAVRELKDLLRLVAQGPHWLNLLGGSNSSNGGVGVSGGGAVGVAGARRTVATLRHPILRCLCAMASHLDEALAKARPACLWSFHGQGSGIELEATPWPFTK